MKRYISLFAFVAVVLLLSTTAMAMDTPELRGTWRGPTKIQTLDRVIESKCAIVIDNQNGNTFTGYKLYFKKNVLQKEKFAGLFDQGNLYFAENQNESGFGYLVDKQSMVINYVDHSSNARVQTCVLERMRFTTGFVEIDKDGDETIMRAEITHYYPLNAERILKEADTNKDDKLTQQEWDRWREKNNWK